MRCLWFGQRKTSYVAPVPPGPQYPAGAAYVYGLREIPGYNYTGPLITVRRSSDNAELDFYQGSSAGQLNTVRGGSGTSLAAWVGAGNNGFVRTWYEQSGNGRNATETTAANQPRIVNAGVVDTQNGLPTIVFGFNANWQRLRYTGLSITQPVTAFFVAKLNQAANEANTLLDGFSSTQFVLYSTGIFESPNNRFLMNANGTGFNAAAQNANFNAHYALFNAANSKHSLNNASDTLAASPIGTNALVGITIGHLRGDIAGVASQYKMKGVISEIVIYGADIPKTDPLQTINSYYFIW